MKKLFLSIISIFTCISSISAQTPIKEMDGADTRFIPGGYMKNGEAAIYFSSNAYGYDDNSEYTAEIFDFNLKPLKSFSFARLTPYWITESRKSSGVMEKTHVMNQRIGEYYVSEIPPVTEMDERKDWFIQQYYDREKYLDPSLILEELTANASVRNDTILIKLSMDNVWPDNYSQYLKSIFVYLAPSNRWGLLYTYGVTVPICDGEWETNVTYGTQVGNLCVGRYYDVENLNHWNGGLYLPFSQTFFNDDEMFEYVRYNADISKGSGSDFITGTTGPDALEVLFGITSTDRDGDGQEDYRSTYYGIHYKGLEVVSEDGSVIYNFPIPDNCTGTIEIRFYKNTNNILAQAEYRWRNAEGNSLQTTKFYRIDKATGVMNVVREETRMCAEPNPASQGTPITISIPNSVNGNSSVTITSINGMQMYHKNIESNTSQVVIPTNNLNSGMYICTISANGNIFESSKIIIK